MNCRYFAEDKKLSPLNPYQAFCGHIGKIDYKDCLTCLRYESTERPKIRSLNKKDAPPFKNWTSDEAYMAHNLNFVHKDDVQGNAIMCGKCGKRHDIELRCEE